MSDIIVSYSINLLTIFLGNTLRKFCSFPFNLLPSLRSEIRQIDLHHENEILKSWIEQYSGLLLKKALYMLSNKEDAEDVVQEVLLLPFPIMILLKGKVSL
jgi:hypothetical protein